jgi:hypothetical protein
LAACAEGASAMAMAMLLRILMDVFMENLERVAGK